MNSKQLYYFTVIVEAGSFTAAASLLNLSQPPLSKQIQLLEEELDIKLLIRNSRSVEPTKAGALLYLKAKNILTMMEDTAKEVKESSHYLRGTLKLGTISSSGTLLTGSFLREFCTCYPHVHFEITEGNTYDLLEKLKNGMIECAIVRTPFNTDGLICAYGRWEPLCAVGKQKHFENLSKNLIDITDLAEKPLIYYRRFEPIISLAFQNAGIEPNIFCKNDDARTSLIWAGTGLGVALVPESISNLSLASDMTVKTIHSDDTITRMAAVYKKNGLISELAKEFISCFEAHEAI